MSEIKYQFAYIDDNRDHVVSIDEITNQNRKQHKYFCIGCGKELLPRAIDSKCRKPHFYHKEEVTCSGETYLHKLAKHVLKRKFDEKPTFFVEFIVSIECSNTSCKYKNPRCREERVPYSIDLKKNYDTCTIETGIKGYVADLLLTNSKNPNVEPTLIEVCVKHPCDEEKRNSGLQIIEIKIWQEQDVINLQHMDVIRELLYGTKRERNVEFISYKREIIAPYHVKLQRYVYEPQQGPIGYLTEIDCNKAHERLRTDSLLELNVVNKEHYNPCEHFVILLWMSIHKGIRRCNLCKFYYATAHEDYPICRLSKKYGKPTYPSMDEAEKCRSYREKEGIIHYFNPNDFLIEEVISRSMAMKPEYIVILAVSPFFNKYDLFKEKILFYLANKMKTHSVVIIKGASKLTDTYTDKLCEETDFIIEPHITHWGKYGESAISVSNDEMTNRANALIAFWDGRSTGIKDLLEKAKHKNIKVAVVKY